MKKLEKRGKVLYYSTLVYKLDEFNFISSVNLLTSNYSF